MQIAPRTHIDWMAAGMYVLLVTWGWFSIHAAEYQPGDGQWVLSTLVIKQAIWIACAGVLIGIYAWVSHRLYESMAYLIYTLSIVLLVLVLFVGKEVSGSRSWLVIGGVHLQTSEFAKYATLLALAKLLSALQPKINKLYSQIKVICLICAPALLVVLQGDTGTALVYSSLFIVTYRGGMNPALILTGIYAIVVLVLVLFVSKWLLAIIVVTLGLFILAFAEKKTRPKVLIGTILTLVFMFGLSYGTKRFLKPYQYQRIQALIDPNADALGYGWNVMQSKIAIGSGGFFGKGYLNGTQIKMDFVPEESTDFIFCSTGEEFGWLGALVLFALFIGLILRVIWLAERQRGLFALLYGYGVAGILFFHFAINIGMTLGLFPVVGIPLPFMSYGGSSLLCFTMLLFTFLSLDRGRKQVPKRF